MASITFALDPELKSKLAQFCWVNWSELVREKLIERVKQTELLLSKLNSKEEQELLKWSVDLGKKAKQDRFKRLLSEISPKTREKLLDKISSKKG